jgi:hypothetical protein
MPVRTQQMLFRSFPNLEELRLNEQVKIAPNLLATIAQESPKIRSLQLALPEIHYRETVFSELTYLGINTPYYKFSYLCPFLKKFLYHHPQIESISLDVCNEKMLVFIIQRMKHLKQLMIFDGQSLREDSLKVCLPYFKQLKRLKRLEIFNYFSHDDEFDLSKEMPQVEFTVHKD